MDEKGKIEMQPWEKPELIVLLRGQPEEAVLAACKGNSALGSSKNNSDVNCRNGGLGNCSDCSVVGTS